MPYKIYKNYKLVLLPEVFLSAKLQLFSDTSLPHCYYNNESPAGIFREIGKICPFSGIAGTDAVM